MDLPTSYVINSTVEIAQAPHYGPYIRLFALPLQAFSISPMATPQSDFLAYRPWAQASIESVTMFSAECWLTARNLFEGIKANEGGVGVPVGAIMSDWPGASITQLSSPAALATCNASSTGVATSGVTFPGPIPGPGPLYSQWNTMAAPLTVGGGLAINNFIYHQGEADVHGWYDPGGPPTSEEVYKWYSCRLRALINDFRGTLGNLPTAWFGVSQLNPYAGDCAGLNGCSHVAALRQAQLDVAQTTPYTTASVIPDGGDPWAPAGSVHSRRKQMVASRLVAGALAVKYGAALDLVYGPRYASFVDASSGGVLKAVVSFTPDSVQGGLELQLGVTGTSWCPLNASATAPTLNECGWWSVKGSSSGWTNATTAVIGSDGVSFELSAPIPGGGSDTVVATAGLWNSYPVATLYSARTQLPVIPWNSSFLAK